MVMKVIAVDFDGTICKQVYPGVGEPLEGAFEVLKELQAAGHKLILLTCREDVPFQINKRHLTQAVELCRENGIEFIAVNETPPEYDCRYEDAEKHGMICIECGHTGLRKALADIYIEDRIPGGFPGWAKIRELLVADGIL